jgi:hypothetical protein
MLLKSIAALVEFTPDAAMHDRDDSTQPQRTEFGVRSKVSDASYEEPPV